MGRCRLGAGIAVTAALALAAAAPANGQDVQLTPFGQGNFATPFHVAAPPGDPNRVFVVEAEGTIRLVKDGVRRAQPFLSIPEDVMDLNETGCECGMFSMAFAPDYAANGLFYVFYTRDDPTPGNQHFLVIQEFRRSSNPDVADPASGREVLRIPHFTASNHNGGQLAFGPDGYLYIATGDGGDTFLLAQDRTSMLGKLLRIDPRGAAPYQYTVPPDNPFADGPGGNADAIYATGLRNPYRFSFDRSTGDLAIGDVGNGAWEEVSFAPEGTAAGANFGWPCFEGTHDLITDGVCTRPFAGHSPPALEYENPPAGAASVNGGFIIRDPALPALAGRYLFADTYGAVPDLRTAQLTPGGLATSTSIGVNVPNVVSFGQDSCGRLYAAAIAGPVSRLDPPTGPPERCKLAPSVTVDASAAGTSAVRGPMPASVSCDEDCDVVVRASVAVDIPRGTRAIRGKKPPKGKKRGKKRKKKRAVVPARRFTLEAPAVSARVQRGLATRVVPALSQADAARLLSAMRADRSTAVVTVTATATGGGGGTSQASGGAGVPRPPQQDAVLKKKPKKKKRK